MFEHYIKLFLLGVLLGFLIPYIFNTIWKIIYTAIEVIELIKDNKKSKNK